MLKERGAWNRDDKVTNHKILKILSQAQIPHFTNMFDIFLSNYSRLSQDKKIIESFFYYSIVISIHKLLTYYYYSIEVYDTIILSAHKVLLFWTTTAFEYIE